MRLIELLDRLLQHSSVELRQLLVARATHAPHHWTAGSPVRSWVFGDLPILPAVEFC